MRRTEPGFRGIAATSAADSSRLSVLTKISEPPLSTVPAGTLARALRIAWLTWAGWICRLRSLASSRATTMRGSVRPVSETPATPGRRVSSSWIRSASLRMARSPSSETVRTGSSILASDTCGVSASSGRPSVAATAFSISERASRMLVPARKVTVITATPSDATASTRLMSETLSISSSIGRTISSSTSAAVAPT